MKKRQYIETTNNAAFLLVMATLISLSVVGAVIVETTDTLMMQFTMQALGSIIAGIGLAGAFIAWMAYPQHFKERHEVITDD